MARLDLCSGGNVFTRADNVWNDVLFDMARNDPPVEDSVAHQLLNKFLEQVFAWRAINAQLGSTRFLPAYAVPDAEPRHRVLAGMVGLVDHRLVERTRSRSAKLTSRTI